MADTIPIFAHSVVSRVYNTKDEEKFKSELQNSLSVLIDNGKIGLRDNEGNLEVATIPSKELTQNSEKPNEVYFLGLLEDKTLVVATSTEGLSIPSGITFKDLRSLLFENMSNTMLGLAGQAVAMYTWHQKNKFCGKCGSTTFPVESGTRRQCSSCKLKHYPRLDPCVITVIESIDGTTALLGRRKGSSWFTAIAGFIEQAETAEQACSREVLEETGVKVGQIIFLGTQPWPPGRAGACELMIACIAKATDETLHLDQDEIEEARWFKKEELSDALKRSEDKADAARALRGQINDGVLRIPGPWAIAHNIIKHWCNSEQIFVQNRSSAL